MQVESTPDSSSDAAGNNTAAAGLTLDTTAVPFISTSGPSSTGTNTPTGRKTPVKPALKASSSMDDFDDIDDIDDIDKESYERKKKAINKKKKKNRKLQWDEAKIQEHDQLRGTRMKIDEPNTPFAHYDSGSETDGSLSSHKGSNAHHKISWDALTNKLEAHATAVAAYPPSSPSSHGANTDNDELEDDNENENDNHNHNNESQKRERQRKELKRLEFQEHRKRHYNEMEVVRRFRRDYPDGVPTVNGHTGSDDDEDDDNDGDDENE